ncbi:hypothetical protein DVA67_028090 [Solirubrobacter sp. CPCC 204708]|uniref:Esterase-like activity of phytase family protein n=1 Tax=Solirubrobacter deserti TaxID=2282478 RepID=A0ABT4RJF2_9ACTN|nr:hypothetical protein [Solirubrobacter deserti]MBE2319858.1 hypothetical protein [Solirubrobacter deserti]MDA0138661.1 hypothetical protein [Solirubrobacter deserti]
MRFMLGVLAALLLLLAPQAASAKVKTLAERDALIHGIAGDDDYVFVTEPGIGVATDGPRVVVLDRKSGREKAVLPAPPNGFKLPFALRSPREGKLVVLDAGGFPPQGPPVVYDYTYSDRKGRFSAKLTRTVDFAGLPLAFAEDLEVLPNGEYVVSESVLGGLWLIGRDGQIRPGLVPPDQGTPLPGLAGCPFLGSGQTVGGLPFAAPGSFAPGAGSLAVRGDELYLSSTCAGGVQKLKLSTLRDSSRPAIERVAEIVTVAKRQYELESLKGITFDPYDARDPWIYAGDPFRLQLIRIHSRTGKREVLSKDAKRLHFTVATAFLPPAKRKRQAPLVTASDQEYRFSVLNTGITSDQFQPPFIVAEYTPR